MKEYIEERAWRSLIILSSIRLQSARQFGVSKSTIHMAVIK